MNRENAHRRCHIRMVWPLVWGGISTRRLGSPGAVGFSNRAPPSGRGGWGVSRCPDEHTCSIGVPGLAFGIGNTSVSVPHRSGFEA